MQTPVVTMKVDPRDLQLIDAALLVFANLTLALYTAEFQTQNLEAFAMETLVEAIQAFAQSTADGDSRRLVLRANKLRESIGL